MDGKIFWWLWAVYFKNFTREYGKFVVIVHGLAEHSDLPVFLIGHSMGGFGVTDFGSKYPNKVEGIVSSGGVTRDNSKLVTGVFDDFDPNTRVANELTDGVCSVEAVRIDYGNDPLNRKSFTEISLISSIGVL